MPSLNQIQQLDYPMESMMLVMQCLLPIDLHTIQQCSQTLPEGRPRQAR